MTTGATGQLGLALPVQGELSGTWGDTVNNGITQYTNIAIAATLTLTGDGAVTLTNTTGDATASNITSSLSGAGTITAQFAIVRITGTLTTTKVVTFGSAGSAPYSKTYLVVNAATGGAVTFKAYGQTGVSIAVGESALVYYNGTDIVKLVGTATAGAAGGSTTQVQYNSSGSLAGSANMTFDGTSMTLGGNPTLSAGTANGVTYLNGSKVLTSGSALTFDGTNLGVGVTPTAWGSGYTVIQLKTNGSVWSNVSVPATSIADNYYANASGADRYLANGYASQMLQQSGAFKWLTAGNNTGGAGVPITFTQAMTLDASGNLLVGTTTNNGGVRGMFSNGANGLPVTSGTTQTYGALRLRGGDSAVIDFGLNSTDTWIQATDLSNLANTYSLLLNPRGGNVGIGATSVDSLFVVGAGTASTYTDVQIKGASTSNYGPYQSWASAGTKILEIASSGRILGGTSTNSFITTVGALDLVFGTNRTEGMRLTSTGLGIGTSSIGRKLEVAATTGLVGVTSTTGTNYVAYQALNTGGTMTLGLEGSSPVIFTGATAYSAIFGTGGAYSLHLATNNTVRQTIDSSGNVLIGGTAARGTTVGAKHLDLFDGTAPAGTLTNGVSLYSSSGDLKFMNATGDGFDVGYRNIPQNSQSAAYTTVLADSGKSIYHPTTDANARTFTIASNASVPYPIGTVIQFVNMTSQVVTIAINTDTMYLAGTGTTGSRSLAIYGVANAMKMTSTTWIITGSGLT